MNATTPTTRNTCFAIISAIEQDLRTFVRRRGPTLEKVDILPSELRDIAIARRRRDDRSDDFEETLDDFDLLDYIDFMDTAKLLHSLSSELSDWMDVNVDALTAIYEPLAGVRNRVCHARPLEFGDLPACVDAAKELTTTPSSIPFSHLRNVLQELDRNPAFALRVQVPAYWVDQSDIPNNLPSSDFEETGFIGRDKDRSSIRRLLKSNRNIITITGVGGVGKTALALRCLYDLLDDPENPYHTITWVSLKTQTLTSTGVLELRNAIQDTLGLLRSVVDEFPGEAEAKRQDPATLAQEILGHMAQTNVLLVVDNLETLGRSDETLRSLLMDVPNNSKVLFTSRIGLGEMEVRYELSPLHRRDATRLFRNFSRVLSLEELATGSQAQIEDYCATLFDNPLLIKWFVESASRNANIGALLDRGLADFQDALNFCCSNIFDTLTVDESTIIDILASARRPLSFVELTHLCGKEKLLSDVDYAVGLLHNSCLVRRERLSNDSYTYRLSQPVSTYVASNRPPAKSLFAEVQKALTELSAIAEGQGVKREQYRFDVFAVIARTQDERVVASYLCRAIDLLRSGGDAEIEQARREVAQARRLSVDYAEVHRVGSLVESAAGEYFSAAEALDQALAYEPESVMVRYTYAQFLMNRLQQYAEAIVHLDSALEVWPNDTTLMGAKALALTRMYRCEEAAELYDRILADLDAGATIARRWRISVRDQAAECYRRWAETDRENRDMSALERHIARALEILKDAVLAGDFDRQTLNRVSRVVVSALWQGVHGDDEQYVAAILEDVSQLGIAPGSLVAGRRGPEVHARIREQWPTLGRKLAGYFGDLDERGHQGVEMPTLTQSGADRTGNVIGEHTGTVTTIKEAGRFGFLRTSVGRTFFHKDRLVFPALWPRIRVGFTAAFELGSNDKGPCAINVEFYLPDGTRVVDAFFVGFLKENPSLHKESVLLHWALVSTLPRPGTVEQDALASALERVNNKITLSDVEYDTANVTLDAIARALSAIDTTARSITRVPYDDIQVVEKSAVRVGTFLLQRHRTEQRRVVTALATVCRSFVGRKAGSFVQAILSEVIRSRSERTDM